MQKKIMQLLLVFTLMSLLLIGCSDNQNDPNSENEQDVVADLENEIDELNAEILAFENQISTYENQIVELENQITLLESQVVTEEPEQISTSLITSALEVMELIEAEDFTGLQNWAHPNDGVRFSPYSYVNTQTDLVFAPQSFPTLMTDPAVLTWGSFDGSGEPIEFNFADYYNRFIYDQDFLNPEIIGINSIVGFGNTLVNIGDVYPTGEFVEFHFTGFDPQYEGMDWRSLILVFEEVGTEWKLIGIIHNEWTI
jgi:hypothetical protein